jgi:CheY-like chemotaxis protein
VDERPPVPDAVLLDVMMPGMDGHEVCREIRSRYPAYLCVIMISAKMSKEDVIHGLTFGLANDYLTKPFDRAILSAKLESRIKLVDAMKASTAHKREDFCTQALRPIFPWDAPETPAAIISFSALSSDSEVGACFDVLSGSSNSVQVRGFQIGRCVITGNSGEAILDVCKALNKTGAVSDCLCFVLRGESPETLLRLPMSFSESPAVRATSEFLTRFHTPVDVKKVGSNPFRDLCQSVLTLLPIADETRRSCTANSTTPAARGPEAIEISKERKRLEVLREVLRLESTVGELKGGLAFEDANLNALCHRMEKAKIFKADFAQKLGLIDDIP